MADVNYFVSWRTHLYLLQRIALGMHFKIWSTFKNPNVTIGGNLNTKALRNAEGIMKNHIKVFSTMAGYLVSPPPAMIPDATGYS